MNIEFIDKEYQENQGAASIAERQWSLLPSDTYYAITIIPACTDHIFQPDEFQVVVDRLNRFRILKDVWELNKSKVLHRHMLAEGSKEIKYKLFHVYGWHIHISPLLTPADKRRWESYLKKDQENDILLRHQFNQSNKSMLYVEFKDLTKLDQIKYFESQRIPFIVEKSNSCCAIEPPEVKPWIKKGRNPIYISDWKSYVDLYRG